MKVITARVPPPMDERLEEYREVLGVTRSEATRNLIGAGLDADQRVKEAKQEERERCEERVAEVRDELEGFTLTPASGATLAALGAGATALEPVTFTALGGTYGPGGIMLALFGVALVLQNERVRTWLQALRSDDGADTTD